MTLLKPRIILLLSIAFFLTGCQSVHTQNYSSVIQSKQVISKNTLPKRLAFKKEPLSTYGNSKFYTVKKKRYEVKSVSMGTRVKGKASWYGKKFHGRLTSNREVFNMHKLTAAHKSIPLPSYVKVTNLNNHKSVIVRVNDRGPFYGDRLIDLSYKAAQSIDMIDAGIALVEIEVLQVPIVPNKLTSINSDVHVATYKNKESKSRLTEKLKSDIPKQKYLSSLKLDCEYISSSPHKQKADTTIHGSSNCDYRN